MTRINVVLQGKVDINEMVKQLKSSFPGLIYDGYQSIDTSYQFMFSNYYGDVNKLKEIIEEYAKNSTL